MVKAQGVGCPDRVDMGNSRLTQHRTRLPILVVGCGAIGTKHIRNLRALGMEEIAACDPDPERLGYAVSEFGVAGYESFEEALDRVLPEAVLLCTPPHLHISQALATVRSGAHVFVEKPLSHSLEGVDELIRQAAEQQLIIQVGYNLRFHPGLQKIKALLDEGVVGRVLWARAEFGHYLPDWRPWEDYRQSYTAHRSMGGGIILDSSHGIDYMRWLLGEVTEVYCLADVVSDLLVDAEDTASMIVRFATGSVGEIHLDFVQRVRSRSCKIVGTEGTLIWDCFGGELRLSTAADGEWKQFDTSCDLNDMYVAEMQSFLSCLDGSKVPPVGGCSARRVLEIALAAHESAATQRAVQIPLRDYANK